MAITPFKVIQDHWFWYQSKAHMRLPITDDMLYNLPPTVSKLRPIIGQIFAVDRGVPHFNATAGVIPANIRINFTSPETRGIVLPDA